MGPIDATRPTHHALSAAHAGGATGPACPSYPGEGDATTALRNGSCLEGPFPSWENAWIDLGGEG
jgi:hypothetical protein